MLYLQQVSGMYCRDYNYEQIIFNNFVAVFASNIYIKYINILNILYYIVSVDAHTCHTTVVTLVTWLECIVYNIREEPSRDVYCKEISHDVNKEEELSCDVNKDEVLSCGVV